MPIRFSASSKIAPPKGKVFCRFRVLEFPLRSTSRSTSRIQSLVDRLNEAVIAEGGRVYLTKDTFTRAEHFRAMEPRLPEWLEVRKHWDPELRIRSAQSVRVLGDPA